MRSLYTILYLPHDMGVKNYRFGGAPPTRRWSLRNPSSPEHSRRAIDENNPYVYILYMIL